MIAAVEPSLLTAAAHGFWPTGMVATTLSFDQFGPPAG
jgi:hypothetical protein